MSFTADVKDELTRVIPTCSHCDKATLAAIARIEGTLLFSGPGRYELEIATEISSVARLVIRSLHTLYKLKTELTVRRSVLHKTPNYLITVPSQPTLKPALHDLGILAKTGIEMGILPHLDRGRRVVRLPICAEHFWAAVSSPSHVAISTSR